VISGEKYNIKERYIICIILRRGTSKRIPWYPKEILSILGIPHQKGERYVASKRGRNICHYRRGENPTSMISDRVRNATSDTGRNMQRHNRRGGNPTSMIPDRARNATSDTGRSICHYRRGENPTSMISDRLRNGTSDTGKNMQRHNRRGEKCNIRHGKEYAETQQKGREMQHRRGEGILDIKEGGGEGISSRNIRPHRTPSSQLKRLEEEVAINEFTRDETPNIFKLSYKIPR